MEVQVNTGRTSSGTAPDHSATSAAIVTAPPAYARRRWAATDPGRPDASTAAGTWRATKGSTTASSHSSHHETTRPASAGSTGPDVPRVTDASRSAGTNRIDSSSPAAGEIKPRTTAAARNSHDSVYRSADAEPHEAKQERQPDRDRVSAAAGSPGRPRNRASRAPGGDGSRRRRSTSDRAAAVSAGITSPSPSAGQTQPGTGSTSLPAAARVRTGAWSDRGPGRHPRQRSPWTWPATSRPDLTVMYMTQ